jgi:hypothetical protein
LELGQSATQPHAELFRLSIDDETLEDPNIVMGIGRLFVNVSKSQIERISKWTGYEVFVDKELALWMVFDRKSTEQYTGGWYPLQCRLSQSISQDTGDEQPSRVLERAIFDIACFLPSLRDITVAQFNSASKKVQETCRQGKIKVDQLDRRETDKRLETELMAQQAILDARPRTKMSPDLGLSAREVIRKIQTVGSGVDKRRQTPAARGEVDFRFFGKDVAFEKPNCEVLKVEGQKFMIDVGSAQAVAVGAIYTVHPSDAGKRGQHAANSPPMQIRIRACNEFQSEGELIGPSPEVGGTNEVEGEMVAVLDTWAYPQTVSVSLQADDCDEESFKAEIQKHPSLNWGGADDKSTDFHVSINAKGNFEVCQAAIGRLDRVPEVSQKDPDAVRKLATIFRHIARYRVIEQLLLSRPKLHLDRDMFQLACLVKDSEEKLRQDLSGKYIAREKTGFDFELTYFGPPDSSVWMALFELNASWGIRKLYPGYGRNAEEVTSSENVDEDVERGGTILRKFSLKLDVNTYIPQKCVSEDRPDTIDQFLVFVCAVDDKSPPSWDEISLPPLPVASEMLNTGDFGAYRYDPTTDELETDKGGSGKRPGKAKKKAKEKPFLRPWNILGFQVQTFPAASASD